LSKGSYPIVRQSGRHKRAQGPGVGNNCDIQPREFSMGWHEEYERKMVTAEEAVKVIKPGDRVHFAFGI